MAILLKQGARCPYTGEQLELGVNDSVDHIIPKARGGPNTIENYQWVTRMANAAKDAMTHEEFIAFCANVAKRHAPQNKTFTYPNADGLDHCVL